MRTPILIYFRSEGTIRLPSRGIQHTHRLWPAPCGHARHRRRRKKVPVSASSLVLPPRPWRHSCPMYPNVQALCITNRKYTWLGKLCRRQPPTVWKRSAREHLVPLCQPPVDPRDCPAFPARRNHGLQVLVLLDREPPTAARVK